MIFQCQIFFIKKNQLTEVKGYRFLWNTIGNKGRFKRSTHEIFEKALKALLSLKKICMSNFHHVPVDLSCKLFDSLIKPLIFL